MKPTPAEFKGWLSMSPGKYFTQYLKEQIQELQDDWANGMFNSQEDSELTKNLNSEALGKVQQIGETLVELEELSTEEEEEDEEVTSDSSGSLHTY